LHHVPLFGLILSCYSIFILSLFTSQLALPIQQSSDLSAGDFVLHKGFQLGNKTRPGTTARMFTKKMNPFIQRLMVKSQLI